MSERRLAEARRWFQQASHDLKAGRWNIQGGFHDTAAFLAQQAGEKALKSVLYFVGARRSALLTHSLVEMIQEAGKKVEGVTGLIEDARTLDLHYIPSRYPNGLPSGYPHQFYGGETAERAMQAAERILDAIVTHYRAQHAESVIQEDES